MNAIHPVISTVRAPRKPFPLRFRCEPSLLEAIPKSGREYGAQSQKLLWKSLKNLLLFPIPPAIGFLLFDSTGITHSIANLHPSFHQIIGHEGLGHAGLCFGLHYLVQSGRALWQAVTLPLPVQNTQPKVDPKASAADTEKR